MRRLLKYKNYAQQLRVYSRLRQLFVYGTPKKIWNAVRTNRAYRRRHIDVRSRPYLLCIEPLYYCNLACPLCQRQTFPDARKNDAGRLSLDIYDKILDEIGDYLIKCNIYGLGEPLMDWNLTRSVIEKTHKRRIFTEVSTNCTLVTPKIAQEIVNCGLDFLSCAIDGVTQETYSKYRVGGSVEKALAGLRMICEEKRKQRSSMEIQWQYLVNRFSAPEMDRAREIAEEIGVFLRFEQFGGTEGDEQLQNYWLSDLPKYSAKIAPGHSFNPCQCKWLWCGVVINSNGQLARCTAYANTAMLGNVGERSVMEIYNGPESQRARQLFYKGEVPDGEFPMPCDTCMYYKREHGAKNQIEMRRPAASAV